MARSWWTGGVLVGAAGVMLAATAVPRVPPDIRNFRPSTNGFAFVNHFTGSPIPFSLGGLETKLATPSEFGLCGGMSFAAADLYLEGKAPPRREKPPLKGEPEGGDAWFGYLQQRQMASLGPGLAMATKFGRWMAMPNIPDRHHSPLWDTRTLTLLEIDQVRGLIDAGKPAVLGLVYNRTASNSRATGRIGVAWENHQVLAFDAAGGGAAGAPITLRIYDSNYPKRDDVRVECTPVITGTMLVGPWGDVRVPVLGAACEHVSGEGAGRRARLVRGFFSMPYESAPVPDKLR